MRVLWRKARCALAAAVVLAAAIAAGAQTAEEALSRAREAASQDRHSDAIRLYREAVAIDSTLAPEVAIELGHQYTWAEKPDSAIIWYSRYLDAHPGDTEARLGLARALSWAGRLDEAEVRYAEVVAAPLGEGETEALLGLAKVKAWREDREGAEAVYAIVLERDSTNAAARLGLAEVMNWSGKHRRSRELCQEVLAREPGNRDATRILAEALYGLGRGDLALDVMAQTPPDQDLDRTAAAIRGSSEPTGSAGYSYWENTDDGIFRSLVFSAVYPTSYLTELGAMYLRGTLHKQGLPDVTRDQFWVTLDHRFSEALAVTVKPGLELNGFSPVVVPPASFAVDEFDLVVWDAYVTATPRDWMRIDAGTFRETMKIHEPLFRRIHVTTENAGLDWRHTHRIATFWQLKYSAYSDGNSRYAASHRGEWETALRFPYSYPHRITAIEGIDYLSFSKTLDNGYYDPSSYARVHLGLRFLSDIGRDVEAGAEGQIGTEKETGNDWTSAGSFNLFLRARVWGGSYVTAGYYQSGSRLDSPDGFRAEGFYVTLDLSRTP
jgi:tetratricopeptide (TPR) repeat protein